MRYTKFNVLNRKMLNFLLSMIVVSFKFDYVIKLPEDQQLMILLPIVGSLRDLVSKKHISLITEMFGESQSIPTKALCKLVEGEHFKNFVHGLVPAEIFLNSDSKDNLDHVAFETKFSLYIDMLFDFIHKKPMNSLMVFVIHLATQSKKFRGESLRRTAFLCVNLLVTFVVQRCNLSSDLNTQMKQSSEKQVITFLILLLNGFF